MALWTFVYRSLPAMYFCFSWVYTWEQNRGSRDKSMFIFNLLRKSFLKWPHHSLFTPAVCAQGFQLLRILFGTCYHLFDYEPSWPVWNDNSVWDWFTFHWLMTWSIFSHALLARHRCSLEKCLFGSFACFSSLPFLLLSCKISVGVIFFIYSGPLSGTWVANSFSHSMGCLLIFLIGSFEAQVLNCDEVQSICFSRRFHVRCWCTSSVGSSVRNARGSIVILEMTLWNLLA